MKLFSNSSKATASEERDAIAQAMARKILRLQSLIAGQINAWFNEFTLRQKKGILLIIAMLFSGILLAGLYYPGYTVPKLKSGGYAAGFLGRPSGIQASKTNNNPIIDSLTQK